MGVEKNLNESRLSKSNSVDIYRPPALRRASSPASEASLATVATTSMSCNTSPVHSVAGHGVCLPLTSKSARNGESALTNETEEANAQLPTTTTIINADGAVGVGTQRASTSAAATTTITTSTTTTRRERRPDRAVYIPRARRSQTTPPAPTTQLQTSPTLTPPPQQQPSPSPSTTIATITAPTASSDSMIALMTCNPNDDVGSNDDASSDNNRTQLPSTSDGSSATLVANTPSTKVDEVGRSASKKSKSNGNHNKERKERHKKASIVPATAPTTTTKSTEDHQVINNNSSTVIVITQNGTENCNKHATTTINQNPNQKESQQETESEQQVIINEMKSGKRRNSGRTLQTGNLRIEDAAVMRDGGNNAAQGQNLSKCDIDEQELQRASKEINRSNRRIMKQTFTSDVLEIPEKIEQQQKSDAAEKLKRSKTTPTTARTTIDSATEEDDEEEDEDDWENMYDESGECLDPKIMQDLTASVGKVKIELPKMDYSAYLTKQSILNEEEFPHVLEVSNFPVEFKNQDLLMVFSQYKESGFDIKWVDDTHALAVFSSPRIAAEVLTMGHPFVVLKPLAEATVESRLKAKKCAASLQPYRPRPETCAALARRLVTGALGVRLETAAAERENEKRVLREAKERKLLAAKQRDEIWES